MMNVNMNVIGLGSHIAVYVSED